MQLSRLGQWFWGLTARAVLVLGVAVAPVDGAAPQDGELDPEVAAAFGLDDGTVVSIDMDRTPNVPVTIVVPINGTDYALNLSPHSVRTDDFVFLVQVADGSLEERDPGPIRTLRGTVEGLAGSSVAGSMLETGLVASIEMPDGDVFWIEPLASKMPHADRDLFVVYHSDDAPSPDGQCGVTEAMLANVARIESDPDAPENSSGDVLMVAELACDADVEYFNRWGSEQGARDRIELVINTMNDQYERDVEILHMITTIIVRTSEPDPYSSTNCVVLLNQFTDHWRSNHPDIRRDLAQLFTGKFLQGCVGIAWFPGVCSTAFGYSVVRSDCCGSLRWATDLSAHEIGHNWNADHCTCFGWTMHTPLQGANKFHATFTIPEIIAFRNSRGCLDVLGSVTLPFIEEWPTQTFDIFKWVETAGVSISSAGSNEPSEPFAAQLNLADLLESREIDASGVDPAGILNFSFYLEEKFTEGNDTFFVDYLDSEGVWRNILTVVGSGSQSDFDFHQFDLPDDAKHADLKIRFRSESGSSDNWYVDNIVVGSEPFPLICIVHGDPDWDRNDPDTWTSFEDWAFSAYIDNKVESTDGVNRDLGLTTFDVVFNTEPFGDNAGAPVTPGNVTVFVTGGARPDIANVTKNGNVLTLELDGFMPLQEWTTFDFLIWNADGVKIVDSGNEGEGVDECSRLDVGTLPSDVNNEGQTQPLDLSRIIASFSAGGTMLPDGHIRSGSISDYFDISRDGLFQPIDISRVIAALGGSAPFTRNWNGVGMNNPQR